MAGEWREATIEEIAEKVAMGPFGSSIKVETFVEEGVPVISGQHLHGSKVDDRVGFNFVTEEHAKRLKNANVKRGDVIFTHAGNIGQAALVPWDSRYERYVISQRQFYMRCDMSTVLPEFVVAYFKTPEGQHRLLANTSQTGVPSIAQPVTYLRTISIPLPPLPEQRAIAHIVGTVDDKIEQNRRMNETLEAMARAIFKSWFVDFAPVRAKAEGRDPGLPKPLADLFPDSFEDSEFGEVPKGWEVGALGRFFEVGLGGAWGNDQESGRSTVAVRCLRGIDCHDLAEARIPDVPTRWVSPKQAADRQLSDGTILVEGSGSFCGRSMIWNVAYAALLGETVGYSNFCKRLDPLCTSTQATVCWMQIRQAYREGLLQSFRTGTAFPNFDVQGALANLAVVVPPRPVADRFDELFWSTRRLDLVAQSRTLAACRDALLPKLVSGELRVKDAERVVAEVS